MNFLKTIITQRITNRLNINSNDTDAILEKKWKYVDKHGIKNGTTFNWHNQLPTYDSNNININTPNPPRPYRTKQLFLDEQLFHSSRNSSNTLSPQVKSIKSNTQSTPSRQSPQYKSPNQSHFHSPNLSDTSIDLTRFCIDSNINSEETTANDDDSTSSSFDLYPDYQDDTKKDEPQQVTGTNDILNKANEYLYTSSDSEEYQTESDDSWFGLNEQETNEKMQLKFIESDRKMAENDKQFRMKNVYKIRSKNNIFSDVRKELMEHITSENYGSGRRSSVVYRGEILEYKTTNKRRNSIDVSKSIADNIIVNKYGFIYLKNRYKMIPFGDIDANYYKNKIVKFNNNKMKDSHGMMTMDDIWECCSQTLKPKIEKRSPTLLQSKIAPIEILAATLKPLNKGKIKTDKLSQCLSSDSNIIKYSNLSNNLITTPNIDTLHNQNDDDDDKTAKRKTIRKTRQDLEKSLPELYELYKHKFGYFPQNMYKFKSFVDYDCEGNKYKYSQISLWWKNKSNM